MKSIQSVYSIHASIYKSIHVYTGAVTSGASGASAPPEMGVVVLCICLAPPEFSVFHVANFEERLVTAPF